MRTLGFRTNALLCLASAAALVLALGRPWYAPAPTGAVTATDFLTTVDGVSAAAGRWLGEPTGTTAWQAFAIVDVICAAMAILAAVAALATLIPSLQEIAGGLLRSAALVAGALVTYHVIDQPGPNGAVELRSGALIALAAAAVLALAGSAVAAAPSRGGRPVAGLART